MPFVIVAVPTLRCPGHENDALDATLNGVKAPGGVRLGYIYNYIYMRFHQKAAMTLGQRKVYVLGSRTSAGKN